MNPTHSQKANQVVEPHLSSVLGNLKNPSPIFDLNAPIALKSY